MKNMSFSDKYTKHQAGKWLFLLLLLAYMPAVTATAQRMTSKSLDYIMTINRSAMTVLEDNVVVSLNMTAIQDVPAMQSVVLMPELEDTTSWKKVTFPPIFLNSRNQQIYFDRILKYDYPNAIALRKKRGQNIEIDYLQRVKYEPWMDNAVLKLYKQRCACNDMKKRGEMTLAAFEKKEEAPEITLFPVYLVPPADKGEKAREESGSAYLCFELNKWDIKPEYMTNPAELQKIHNSVNLVRNDVGVTIRKMTIEGYASPEGTFKHNKMLSENRTNALKNYLIATNITKGIKIEASGKGENWPGLVSYLKKNSDTPQCSKLLTLAKNNSLDPDDRERRMKREAPQGYNYILKNVYPRLRCTNYTVVYTVRPFTLEESEQVFETRPINLSLNEIYRLADKYADNQEKYYSIMRKASLLYPNDTYVNLTMAFLAIKRQNVEEATEYLNKVKDCPQKTMNQGLIAYLTGDLDKAVQLVQQANLQGVQEAAEQLKEFDKLIQYNNKNKKNNQ